MVNKAEVMEAVKAFLAATNTNPAAAEADSKGVRSERKVASSVPIIAPETRPEITVVKTLGQAVAQAIDEDPVASKLPPVHRQGLAYAIYEQLKNA